MGLPGYGTDQVDREFDNLLRAARQAPLCRSTTPGTEEVEQRSLPASLPHAALVLPAHRRERLPATPGTEEVGQRRERLPEQQSASDAVSVSDAQFESLLTAFKSLNDSRSAGDVTRTVDSRDGGGRATPGAVADEQGAPPPPPADSRATTAATQLSRAWRDFASQPAIGQNPDLQQAVRRLECLTINLQLALPGTAAQAVLAVGVAGQSFALAAAQIVEVLDVEPASLAHDGQRACIVTGAERLPLYFLRDWLVHGDLDETVGSHSRIVVVIASVGHAGIVVDSVDGMLTAAVRPLGALLRGTPGLKGMVVAGGRALPLLDLAVLLGDAAPGRAGYGAKDAKSQN